MISGDIMAGAKNTVTAEETRRAVEQMRRMSSRSRSPNGGCVKENETISAGSKAPTGKAPTGKAPLTPSPGIPFLRNFGLDPDMALILGLLLILTAEGSDKLLLLALIYILF